jgi:hypothetical protein
MCLSNSLQSIKQSEPLLTFHHILINICDIVKQGKNRGGPGPGASPPGTGDDNYYGGGGGGFGVGAGNAHFGNGDDAGNC